MNIEINVAGNVVTKDEYKISSEEKSLTSIKQDAVVSFENTAISKKDYKVEFDVAGEIVPKL